ncbi:MAG: AI-2E family transporter [Candidatus Staskawiczbacteria bacterium]|nr:AI-2E family transporter [Candidatus Staskawiczbacteria bacterium]
MADQTLDISWMTIAKVFFAGLVLYVLFLVRDIAVWFFFALVISILLETPINFLRRMRIPKIVSVILVYLSIFGLLGLVLYLAAPVFLFEIKQLSQNIPSYFEKLNPILNGIGLNVANNFEDLTSSLASALQESSGSIIGAISVFFGGITSTILIFVFAFYISLEENGPERVLLLLAPKKYEGYILAIFERAQFRVSGWFVARILACMFVGLASFAVLFLMGIKYAFILALIAGVLNFMPFVGPLIAALLAVSFVGVSNSWLLAVYVVIVLSVVQSVENNIVNPLLMKKFLDLPPILVLMSLLVGGIMFGFLGMIFMVPVFGIIYEFLKEFLEKRREEENFAQ